MSENFVPDVRLGTMKNITSLYVKEKFTIETSGTHRKLAWVDSVVIEYVKDPRIGYWKWATFTALAYDQSGNVCLERWEYGEPGVPFWAVALIHTHIPEYRKS